MYLNVKMLCQAKVFRQLGVKYRHVSISYPVNLGSELVKFGAVLKKQVLALNGIKNHLYQYQVGRHFCILL